MLLMGKLTISMAIFNSYVSLPESMSKCSAFFGMSSGCVGCGTAPWPNTSFDSDWTTKNLSGKQRQIKTNYYKQ